MLATARCFVQPLYGLENILKAILRDEFIAWKKVWDILIYQILLIRIAMSCAVKLFLYLN